MGLKFLNTPDINHLYLIFCVTNIYQYCDKRISSIGRALALHIYNLHLNSVPLSTSETDL